MTTNHNKLALRKQSIRILTATELRVVAGGYESGSPGPVSTAGGGETNTTRAKVRVW